MARRGARFRGWFVRGSTLSVALPALLAGPLIVVLGLIVPAAMPVIVLGFLLSLALVIAVWSARVEVGDDGVLIAPVFGRSTFVPIGDIERVEPVEGLRIRIHLRAGGHVDVETRREENIAKQSYVERCDALLAAIEARLLAREEETATTDAERVVSAALERSTDDGTDYRARIAVDDAAAREVLADGRADFATRASAAALLRRRHGDASGPELVRIAETNVEPDLKAFLGEAAELEAEAIDEALREAIDAHARRRS